MKENIAQFGGNSSQITVGGQSAGSASALDAMWSPLAKGLVQGVIAESGARGPHDPVTGSAATSYRTKGAAERQGVRFLKTMNVTSIDQLRKASTTRQNVPFFPPHIHTFPSTDSRNKRCHSEPAMPATWTSVRRFFRTDPSA